MYIVSDNETTRTNMIFFFFNDKIY